MAQTTIEWTASYKDDGTVLPGFTFNPWQGCTRVSPGCQHCYAETMMDKRFGKVKWGPLGKRIRTSADYWKQPLKWNREAATAGERRRVFCASLADVFETKPDQVDDLRSWRFDLWNLIDATPWLDWLILTKRPENVNDIVPYSYGDDGWPPNVWIGTSVENQEQADKRIPELLKIPAAVRFLSVEPMLGPIDLHSSWAIGGQFCHKCGGFGWYDEDDVVCPRCVQPGWTTHAKINWVIVGGESGPDARPMHPDWAREIRDQCGEAGVPFFFKQQGEWTLSDYDDLPNVWVDEETGKVVSRHNSFPEPPPFNSAAIMKRIGKKQAGRQLDGREWNEFPISGRKMR